MIHSLADVQSTKIGKDTRVWQFCVILAGAEIGNNCNLNANVFVENDVVIGDNVTIKSGVQIWDGITLEDNVFIGPNATFTNDLRPRSKQYPDEFAKTKICRGASIGANSTILPNLTIGEYAMISAGSVVAKNVPPRALVMGVPGKVVGWLNLDGTKMEKSKEYWMDNEGNTWREHEGKLIQVIHG